MAPGLPLATVLPHRPADWEAMHSRLLPAYAKATAVALHSNAVRLCRSEQWRATDQEASAVQVCLSGGQRSRPLLACGPPAHAGRRQGPAAARAPAPGGGSAQSARGAGVAWAHPLQPCPVPHGGQAHCFQLVKTVASLERHCSLPCYAPDSDGGRPQLGHQHEATTCACMALEGPGWLGHALCSLALLLIELAAGPFGEEIQMLQSPQIRVWPARTLGKGAVLTGRGY